MKNKFKELKEFTDKSSRFVKQLAKLNKERNDKKEELKQLNTESEELITLEAVTGEPIDKVKLNRLTKESKKLKRDIEQLELRIKVTEEKRPDYLRKYLNELENGYIREMDKLRGEVENRLDGITPIVSRYLKYLLELGELNNEAYQIHRSFIEATEEITDEYQKKYRFGFGWMDLKYELFGYDPSIAGAYGRGVTEKEQLNALKGEGLPPPIALYNLTGDVEADYSKATRKYNKSKKEINNNKKEND